MKLFFPSPHDTISSVAASSTMSYVFSRNGAGPPPPPPPPPPPSNAIFPPPPPRKLPPPPTAAGEGADLRRRNCTPSHRPPPIDLPPPPQIFSSESTTVEGEGIGS